MFSRVILNNGVWTTSNYLQTMKYCHIRSDVQDKSACTVPKQGYAHNACGYTDISNVDIQIAGMDIQYSVV